MKFPQQSKDRFDLWKQLLNSNLEDNANVAEVGVWKGAFAKSILGSCSRIGRYTMIDPWANLPDWNKPLNVTKEVFDDVYKEAMKCTEFAANKRSVLRGRTKEVVHQIEDESLDFIYIDGDHTLRGIVIDLITLLPKVKVGGIIGGDDFTVTPWQHSNEYEPTLVCPFAIYFAEAMNLPIHALPHSQFLIEKTDAGFTFNDTTEKYGDLGLNKMPPPPKAPYVEPLSERIKRRLKGLFT